MVTLTFDLVIFEKISLTLFFEADANGVVTINISYTRIPTAHRSTE
jgi:hypothetical protein